MYIYFHYLFLMKIKIFPIFCKSSDMKKKLKWFLLIYDMSPPNKYTMTSTMKYCESCEGECLSDVMEYCECCGVGKRNGCEMNPSDESIFDGMCDECRENEEEEEELCKNCDDTYQGKKEPYCIMGHQNCGKGLPHISSLYEEE